MKRKGEDTKVDGLVEQGILQEPGMQRTGVRKGIGLVLVGGGGRGAYHIGVWNALRDTGLENYITAVSGSSVGGLNAALFVQKDLDKAQDIWKSISMETILTPRFKSEHSRPALFERDGLGRIIDEGLDMRCFDNGEYNCWIACVRVDGGDNKEEEIQYINFEGRKVVRKYVCGRTEYFNLKHVQGDDTRKKILLATSAMPLVFPKEEIDGHHYEDGGIKDNIPLRPLYEIDKCDVIFAVHLANTDNPINRKRYPNATIFEIFPKGNLGGLIDADGVFDFTAEGAAKRIGQGYADCHDLFRRMTEIIRSGHEERNVLADAYMKELQYDWCKKKMQEANLDLMMKLNEDTGR